MKEGNYCMSIRNIYDDCAISTGKQRRNQLQITVSLVIIQLSFNLHIEHEKGNKIKT